VCAEGALECDRGIAPGRREGAERRALRAICAGVGALLGYAHVAPNNMNTLVVPDVFVVDLYLDPDDPRRRNDVYIMLNEDGSEHQRRNVSDEAVSGGDRLTLVFTGLRAGLRYSLLVDEGSAGQYYAFHNILFEDLVATDANPQATIDSPGDQPLPTEYSSLQPEQNLPALPADLLQPQSSGWAIAERDPSTGTDEAIV